MIKKIISAEKVIFDRQLSEIVNMHVQFNVKLKVLQRREHSVIDCCHTLYMKLNGKKKGPESLERAFFTDSVYTVTVI